MNEPLKKRKSYAFWPKNRPWAAMWVRNRRFLGISGLEIQSNSLKLTENRQIWFQSFKTLFRSLSTPIGISFSQLELIFLLKIMVLALFWPDFRLRPYFKVQFHILLFDLPLSIVSCIYTVVQSTFITIEARFCDFKWYLLFVLPIFMVLGLKKDPKCPV